MQEPSIVGTDENVMVHVFSTNQYEGIAHVMNRQCLICDSTTLQLFESVVGG